MGHEDNITDAQDEAPKARSLTESDVERVSLEKNTRSCWEGRFRVDEEGHVSFAWRAGMMLLSEAKAPVAHTRFQGISPAGVSCSRDARCSVGHAQRTGYFDGFSTMNSFTNVTNSSAENPGFAVLNSVRVNATLSRQTKPSTLRSVWDPNTLTMSMSGYVLVCVPFHAGGGARDGGYWIGLSYGRNTLQDVVLRKDHGGKSLLLRSRQRLLWHSY